MRSALLAVVLLLAPGAARSADDTAALVARVIASYGGRPALERARVVRQEGTVTSVMHQGPGRLLRLLKRPGSLRVEIAYPGEPPEVRVVHYGYGQRGGREVTGPMHAAMVLQAARLALPLSLVAENAGLSDRGTVDRGGERLRVLALPLPDGLELVVEIEPRSGFIVRSSGAMPRPGGRMEFATAYSDFRKVSGVVFPFHEENWAGGQHTGATSLTKVEVLPDAPASAFDGHI